MAGGAISWDEVGDASFEGTINATSGSFTGEVNALSGTFKNVDIQSGKIAGINISGNGLTNEGFNNDAYIILRNDLDNTFTGIGSNTLPSSLPSHRSTSRFENRYESEFYNSVNYATRLRAEGAQRNVAVYAIGDMFLSGANISVERVHFDEGYLDSITLNITKSRRFLFTPNSDIRNVNLPTGEQLINAFGSDLPDSWSYDIEVVVDHASAGEIMLRGGGSGVFGGALVSHDGNLANHNGNGYVYGAIRMSKGNSVRLRYHYYNSRWQLLSHNY